LAVEFDKRVLLQRDDDDGQMGLEKSFEFAGANVTRPNEQ
jgi:hypothetical protein